MDDDLTDAGWPRPIVDGWPVPWVSPKHELSRMHDARAAASATGAVCAVCGLGYQDGETAYVLVKADAPPGPDDQAAQAMDNAIMHERCARLAVAVCPKLKRLRSDGRLRVLRTVGNRATIVPDDDGVFHAQIDREDFEDVGSEVPRS